METIGFSLYMELLENAVDARKQAANPRWKDLTVSKRKSSCECRRCRMIFIPDVNTRLEFYKRIASAKNENELEEIRSGRMIVASACCPIRRVICWISPACASTERKSSASENWGNERRNGEFAEKNHIDPARLIGLLQNNRSISVWMVRARLQKFIQDLSERKTRRS